MISFNNLGNLGRLANQMFQYASLKGIARNRGYDFSIPPREVFGQNDGNVKNSDVILYDVFPIDKTNDVQLVGNSILQERIHNFDEELFENCPDNVDLFGYYQSEKYFKNIEDEIRKDFSFSNELNDICTSFISENFGSESIVSLHVRRGDYTLNSNHPIQSTQYYEEALNKFSDLPVIIFSDDPDWCDQQQLFSSDRFLISKGNATDFDLCLMSHCHYHIIANSSFSWWGAWLAKSGKIIAPKNWFSGDCVNKSVKDMEFNSENWSWL